MIEFQKLRWKNFLSYGNSFSEIDFKKHSMTLISGKNGSGKSTIGEALTFVLFGVPFRNINKGNLLNSINEKDCLVEIEFAIGKKNYKIRRGIKPNVFEIFCDGKLIDQESKSKDYQKYLEQTILKLNYQSFTQLVFLGSGNFVPFMELPALARREVIEELLDIRVFSRMNGVLKGKISLLKEQIKDIDRDISLANEKYNMQKEHIKKLKDMNLDSISKNNQEIEISNETISNINLAVDSIKNNISNKLDSIADLQQVTEENDRQRDMYTHIRNHISKIEKTIEFYKHKNVCPSCSQNIDDNFKQKMIDSRGSKLKEWQQAQESVLLTIDTLKQRIKEINQIQEEIDELQKECQQKYGSISGINQYISKLQKENQRLSNFDEVFEKENENLKLYEEVNLQLSKTREEMIDTRHLYDISADLLKDTGIKTRIIKQYLPVMNKLINKYLSSMDFFVNFNLDENFKEIIKSRYRDEFEYNSFSQGQKFRIDMALLLTWREISRKKNSTNTNILILDEVFDSSLDAAGTEEFMKLLRVLSKKTHIFVISHKPDVIGDKFDNHIKVQLKNNFSTIC